MQQTIGFLGKLYTRIRDDDVPALGAEFAYHLLLSLFPFLLFLATVATYSPLAQQDGLSAFAGVVPAAALEVVRTTLAEITDGNRTSILSVSMIVTIWLASNGFAAVTRGLNKAYDVRETRKFYVVRGLSLLFILLITLGILLEAVAIVFGNLIVNWLSAALRWSAAVSALGHALRIIIPMLTLLFIFTLLYSIIPNRRLGFLQVLPGAAFTSVVWVLASLAFSFYVDNFANYARVYGSLGGVVILLIWLYMSSVVMLVGCELNATLFFEKERKEEAKEGKEKRKGKGALLFFHGKGR